jgi:DNA invertase Pin-like site-specific DNA recombinase
MEREGFDAELQKKLASKLYSFSQITRDTGISRYWLNNIKNNVQVPGYIIVALNDYFKKVS